MASIFKLILLCIISFSNAQEEDLKTRQKWYDMNSLFIRYGFRAYDHCQLRDYTISSKGRRIEMAIQDLLTKREDFYHISARWTVDTNKDAAEIQYMLSKQQAPNETIFNIGKNEIEANTCIKFVEVEETAEKTCGTKGNIEYFCVYEEEGTCAGEYGQNLTKPSLFSISENCGQRELLHEFGHILGLHHATSRYDRGEYIDVSFKQIGFTDDQFYRRGIFQEYQRCNNSLEQQLGMPYDYTSIMHPGLLEWSENYELVMVTHSPSYLYMIDYIQDYNPHLSHYDRLMLNRLFQCDTIFGKKCGQKKCGKLGYLAKNCTCICPKGTSGDSCSSEDSTTDIYDIASQPSCYKKVDAEDTEFSLLEAGLVNVDDLQPPFTQHCVIEVVAGDECKLPMVSIDARKTMQAMENRIKYWFDNDALECSYFSVFYNVSRTKTRNICWDMLAVKPMYWIFSKQRNFWIFARFRDDKIATVAGGIHIYFHSTGDYRCDLNGNDIFDAINAGRARSIGGGEESAKAMAIVLPAAAVCLLMVLGFIYMKFIRKPMELDEEQPPEGEEGGGGEGGEDGGDDQENAEAEAE